jgi:hypothetical protein
MTPTPSQASERERFEAAWVKRGLLHPSRSSEPGYTDQYESPIAQNGWVMWQARAALSAPPAQAPHASNPQILKAYELGFLRAAEWARRDDLRADLDSGAYAKDRARDLGPMLDAPPTAQAAPVAAIRDQALEDAAEERDALIKENDLLRQHAAKQISDGTMLTGIVIRNGAAEIGLEGGACGLLADSFAKQFLDGGAMNYLELKFESQTVMPGVAFVVTLQRVDGETPAQQLKAAQAERDALKADAKQAPATQTRDQALEDAAQECENQVPTGCSTHIADVARNQGIRMCTDAIRAMKGAT